MNQQFFARMLAVVIVVSSLLPTLAHARIEAVVSSASGDVEIQDPGASWREASVGDRLEPGTRISTGFGANASIEIGENVLRVRALTRLTLEELVESEDQVDTDVLLEIGRVRGEVRSGQDRRQEFRLRSPTATASVRGTSFDFDGNNLEVDEGFVTIENRFGQEVLVAAGEEGSVVDDQPPEPPASRRRRETAVSTNTTIASSDDPPPPTQPTGTGLVTVIIRW